MALPHEALLTYADYAAFPDDGVRRELIDGEVVVTPAPNTRHQDLVVRLVVMLSNHVGAGGGRVFVAPYDVVLTDHDVVQPDVVFVADADAHFITRANLQGRPTLAVEVMSDPRADRVRKRDLYARHGVPEYWIADPDADRLEVHRLPRAGATAYPKPELYEGGERVSPLSLPALVVDLDELFRR